MEMSSSVRSLEKREKSSTEDAYILYDIRRAHEVRVSLTLTQSTQSLFQCTSMVMVVHWINPSLTTYCHKFESSRHASSSSPVSIEGSQVTFVYNHPPVKRLAKKTRVGSYVNLTTIL